MFGTEFSCPEEQIIVQNDSDSSVMYYLARGDCTIDIKDQTGFNHICFKLLVEGDHFGEISLLYGCKRTATVNARNYTTIATLTRQDFKEMTRLYPIYNKYLLIHVYKYQYKKKSFLKEIVKRVEYLEHLTTA